MRGSGEAPGELPTKFSTDRVDGRTRAFLTVQPSRRAAAPSHNRALQRGTDFEGIALLTIVQAAGWPIWPLILCSVVAVALVIERLMALRTARVCPGYLLDEVITVTRNGLPPAEVINKLAENSLLGSVLAAGLRLLVLEPRAGDVALRLAFEAAGRNAAHKLERYLNTLGTIAAAAPLLGLLGSVLAAGLRLLVLEPRAGDVALRLAFEAAGRNAAHKLERYLNTLGTIAAAAPLLGLLGTVVGMIEIFGSQGATGSTNPADLAHGISVALYNTALGLMVAIPSLMFYRYFRGRVDDALHTLEQSAEQLQSHLTRLSVRLPAGANPPSTGMGPVS